MSVQAREVVVIPATIGNHIDSTIKRQLRVASYSRVSTDHEDQLSSFQNQQAYYSDLILKNPNWTPAGNFAEEPAIIGRTQKIQLRTLFRCMRSIFLTFSPTKFHKKRSQILWRPKEAP